MDAEDQRKKKNEAVRREMERKQNDEILIYNPREEDYQIKYGGYVHTVPNRDKNVGYGKGCLVVARYLAKHYIKHIVDLFIIEENERKLAKAKLAYKGAHWPEEEQKIALRTDNPELRKQYMTGLWKGIYRKFGLDETATPLVGKPEDKRPLDERLLEELEADMEKEVELVPRQVKTKKKKKSKESKDKKELSDAIKEEA